MLDKNGKDEANDFVLDAILHREKFEMDSISNRSEKK